MQRHFYTFFLLIFSVLLLTQCNSMRSDCEAIAEREKQIAQEPPGDYYIGRRYYLPTTRFWGYLRKPQQSWRDAKLVIMNEKKVHTPDRGIEPPSDNAVFGTDHNFEYIIHGKMTKNTAYEPNSNQVLPVFVARSYQLRQREAGFLFKPSEEYKKDALSLVPKIMPNPEACASALQER